MFTNSGINKVFLVGNIGKEPKLHNFTDQPEVLCFPLVTKEIIKKNGEDFELVEWHNIKIPKDVAATNSRQLQKGYLLHVEGKIQTRSFYDEQQIKKYKLEIIVTKFQVLSAVPEPETVLQNI
ncbi:single-stranded DNA-binding protein [Mucilaginibacter arboris]|uniref:Single-stranded DNA-binding protein n=1 Tax=Mucilaginibacter arboris TaxID=2682090 RepID=A0A7K1SYI0_9SPHI|nr:single-stranded DNA-binding protein [Mucilaginibacter arboris]MVN22372.1 single-stranded DNA-binding protein [Mucilaginibacter arboris]